MKQDEGKREFSDFTAGGRTAGGREREERVTGLVVEKVPAAKEAVAISQCMSFCEREREMKVTSNAKLEENVLETVCVRNV